MGGLFASLLGATTQTSGSPPPDADYWYSDIGGYGGARSNAGRWVSPEVAMRISAVYACVNLLAKTVASIPLSMYRTDLTGARFAAPTHPLNDLLERQPNNWQTAYDFKAMMMMHLALRGNAYAEIIPGPRGAVDMLQPLHPDTVQVQRLVDGSLRYQVTENNGIIRRLVQAEVLHIRSAICPSGIVGISPVAYAKETVGLTLAAEEHGSRIFSNGARPSGVITLAGRLKPEDFERFKRELNQQYSSVSNANKTMVLEEGAQFTPMTMKADEIAFIATRMLQIEEIARWFDVPLVMLHSNDKTTSWGTGVEAIMLAFVRNNLMPWLMAWQQAISRDLIIAPRIYSAEFDVSALQRGDSAAMAQFFQRLVLCGVLTRNEARTALRYNSIEGLSEPLIPMNTTPSSRPAAEPVTPSSNPGQDSNPNEALSDAALDAAMGLPPDRVPAQP